jgi:hypothetical protein
MRVKYEIDDSQVYNAVEVYGRSMSEEVGYTFMQSTTATDFYFPRVFGSISVSMDGTSLRPGVDYEYRPESKMVKLLTTFGQSATTPKKFEISASADLTPVMYGENSTSIASYGKRGVAAIVDNMSSETDLQTFLNKFLELYSSARTTLHVIKPGLDFGIKNGGYVTVYDPYLGINGQTFVVRVVRWKYPEGVTEMVLDSFIPELYDFQRKVNFTLEKLSRTAALLKESNIIEKKVLYISGPHSTGNTWRLVENRASAQENYGIFGSSASPVFMRLNIRFVGATTVQYNTYTVGTTTINQQSSTPIPFIGEAIVVPPADIVNANASNQISIGVQIFASTSFGGTQYQIAPPATASDYFTITYSNMQSTTVMSIGVVLYVRFASGGYDVYWGPNYPSAIYYVGLKKQ